MNSSLLPSLNWLIRLKEIPRGKLPRLQGKLFKWLENEEDPHMRGGIIEILGYWPEDTDSVGLKLLAWINNPLKRSDLPAVYKAVACLAVRRPRIAQKIRQKLRASCSDADAAAALIRLSIARSKGVPQSEKEKELDKSKKEQELDNVLKTIARASSDPYHALKALLEAGIDDDIWDDEYHGLLVNEMREHLEVQINQSPDQSLLADLLTRLEQALRNRDWPSRRFLLAVVAACTEIMPMAVQQAYDGDLEKLLVRATTDAESFNSRRFALTALSYLRTVTSEVVPALLVGCYDTEVVQNEIIDAVSHFQSIEGDPLPALIEEMSGESVSRAYMITHLLGALGSSAAAEIPGLRDQIIEAVVDALKNRTARREVRISGENKGTLEDALYTTLLRVAGWMG
jgi:hypothetical protein